MKDKLKLLFKSYGDLLKIIWVKSPHLVWSTFAVSILAGFMQPLLTWSSSHIFDDGLKVAAGDLLFVQYIPYLVIFAVVSILPQILDVYIFQYVEHNSLLILRTSYRDKMLKKLKTMEYKHMENDKSIEIMDRAFTTSDSSARHMFPMYIKVTLSGIIASIGYLYLIYSAKWWLLITILLPFIIEIVINTKHNYNVYDDLQKFWKQERKYFKIGDYLKNRDYVKENKLFNSSTFLIKLYSRRLKERNKEYEKYYFKHLKSNLLGRNITKIATIVNVILYLYLYVIGDMSIGMFIALASLTFTTLYNYLNSCMMFFIFSGYHIKFFEYYKKFFDMSDDKLDGTQDMPENFTIEFKDVCFKYPDTEKEILKNLSFKLNSGEKIALVGKNGEGKTTTIKLLLGLFKPDSGEILINDKPLNDYSHDIRTKIFAPVFQDFVRYSLSLKENVGVGHVDDIKNPKELQNAFKKGNINSFLSNLKDKENTLLNRDFEGGVDLSGGQWQRIALARAFMGNKPVMLLDEPTSQLDPMAEAELYREFAGLVQNKTAVFITHRLGSTKIVDRILVLDDGSVTESGSHDELIELDGIYSNMFNEQKKWYDGGESNE